jgi:hypothetical protein
MYLAVKQESSALRMSDHFTSQDAFSLKTEAIYVGAV